MEKLKFDSARNIVKYNGKKYKAQQLDYFVQQNTFDKHKSIYFNKGGLTYVLFNEPSEEEEEIFFPINLQYQDTDEQKRLFAMKNEQDIEEINEIKKEYGIS